METPTVIVYHANCPDGFAAAWITKQANPNAQLIAAVYGDLPPADLAGVDVIIVDFSYPVGVLRRLASIAGRITVLDHHNTAKSAIESLLADGIIDGIFDQSRAGAMLAWNWFFPNSEPPPAISYVQDRDLWRHELPDTEAVNAAIASYAHTMKDWSRLMSLSVQELVAEGHPILRRYKQDLENLLVLAERRVTIATHSVPLASVPPHLASDAGAILSASAPFSATYWDSATHRHFSLRSQPRGGMDVAAIAESYGGGGHPNAAGFRVPREHPLATV